ncbi:MAG TPA: phosphatidate cytidylyltransferase [Burkholderiales bacterium]|nr:phosphatidate cytidylyltransferase [Burkholderiales bacterium]
MLKTRIYTVLVLLPLLIAALFYLPANAWALVLAPLALVSAWEWGALAGWRPAGRLLYVCSITAGGALLWYFGYGGAPGAYVVATASFGVAFLFWLVVAPLWLVKGWRIRSPLILAVTGAVLLLPPWLALIQLQGQPGVLLMLMAIVWISDTAAYFCGKRWGRHKLAETISPGKTWEGVFGAMAGVAIYYVLLSAGGATGHGALQGIMGFGVFLLLTVLGIEGDLFESWIKRTANVKDSGTVFPGHGGVLDRIDALTASMPAAALLLNGMA